jgi:hypothetical protein
LSIHPFRNYSTLPLSQLPFILKEKIIPYYDNVSPLRDIEKRAPRAFQWAEVPPLKSNTIMHESAHAYARVLRIQSGGKVEKPTTPVSTRRMILGALIEEAFANTCECLANLEATTPLHDEFLHQNSYIMESKKDRALLLRAKENLGHQPFFRLLLLSFLSANFLKTRFSDSDLIRALKLSEAGPKSSPSLIRSVIRIGMNLDSAFTQFTGSFCFRLMGVQGNIYEFLAFDFMHLLEEDPFYLKWMDALQAGLFDQSTSKRLR